MNKFLTYCGTFTVLLLALNVLLGYVGGQLYDQDYGTPPMQDGNYLLADSHGKMLADFGAVHNLHNFSAAGDSYQDMERKLSYLIRSGVTIDTLYLSVDAHMLSPYRERANNLDRSYTYASFTDYPSTFMGLKDKLIRPSLPFFRGKMSKVVRTAVANGMRRLFGIHAPDSKQVLHCWTELSEDERHRRARERAEKQFPTDNKSTILTQSLQAMVEQAHGVGITVIGIRFPITQTYAAMIAEQDYGAHRLLARQGIPIIDLSSSITDNRYFRDQDHLNEAGAKLAVDLLVSSSPG